VISAIRYPTAEITNLKSYASQRRFLRLLAVISMLGSIAGGQIIGNKEAPDSGAVIRQIESQGATSVVRELTAGNGKRWESVTRAIETGSQAWLDVANKLIVATDAGRTEELEFALSLGLTRNPVGVLSLVGPNLPIDRVCSVPYIEPDEKTVAIYRMKVKYALRKVTDPNLASRKAACLSAVNQ
jgi:hypothetical protein